MKMNNKKGAYDFSRKALYYIIVIFMIGFMFMYMFKTMSDYNFYLLKETPTVRHEVVITKLLTSPSCLAYLDKEINRVYPGVIDKNKVTEDNIKNCLKFTNYSFSLRFQDKVIETNGKNVIEEFQVFPVLVYDNGNIYPDYIRIFPGEFRADIIRRRFDGGGLAH